MAEHTTPSQETRAEEAEQARSEHEADRAPTTDEEAAAESATIGESTKKNYEEMAERGANVKGEGEIP